MATAINHGNNRRVKSAGFTLVEMMVVIAISGLLAAIMLPALSTAKEKSRRAICKSNLHQLLLVLNECAYQNEDYLPSCADDKGYYHSIVVSDVVFTNLVEMSGGNSNILYCPNIVFGANSTAVKQYITNIGYVIGYSYLAATVTGSPKAPDVTVQPMKMPTMATSTTELLADANFWTPISGNTGYFPSRMKVAPHTAAGAAMARSSSFTVGLPGNSSASIGEVGGNVGFADGHVDWKTLPQMQTNTASSLQDAYGTW